MQLPPFPDVSHADLAAIADRHQLTATHFTRLPQIGICNAVYRLGEDYVLRVPRDVPRITALLAKEAIVAPAGRAAGIHTPALVAFDDTLDLLPVPYIICERARGETLGLLGLEPAETPDVWRAVGRDLALLHTRIADTWPLSELHQEPPVDVRSRPRELAEAGHFTAHEARWLERWLDRLAPAALAPVPLRFCHCDVQATNVIVSPGAREYVALLDWGDAHWCDPAWDFAGMPLRAVPFLLEGHREVAPLDGDDTAEARILWRHLQLAMYTLRRGPQPGLSWAGRSLTMLLDVLRFFAADPPNPWRDLQPPT